MSDVGSISKHHIIQDLEKAFLAEPGRVFKILDVGITGPEPLAFWRPLFKHPNFELAGIDIDAPSIESLKKTALPLQVKRLEALSGYDLLKKFEPASFDIVVSTQVLEHMRHPDRCLDAVAAVLKPGGTFYLTFDSAEHPRSANPFKALAKRLVVRLTGSERYHDEAVAMSDVVRMLQEAGCDVIEQRLFSLHPLKELYAWETPDERKAEFMAEWKRFEDYLHRSGHAARAPERYLNGYCKAVKK